MSSHHHPIPLNRLAFRATVHCLTGCGIGEVLGMVIGTALGWSNTPTMVLAILLAFGFGYALTMVPLLRSGLPLKEVLALTLAADTASITLMEIIDNGVLLLVPGAMNAPVTSVLFWASLLGSLLLAGVMTYPLNRWLIGRGRGHALVHAHHQARPTGQPGGGDADAGHSSHSHHHHE